MNRARGQTPKEGSKRVKLGNTITRNSSTANGQRRSKLSAAGYDENLHPNIQQTKVDMSKTMLVGKKVKLPAYMQSLNSEEKADNFKIIDSMNKKI